jgi:DNA topoisomerase-3
LLSRAILIKWNFQREGFSKFNKIYEFQYLVQGRPCDMSMTSVSGHLLNFDFEEKYRKWWSCAPIQLFDLPVVKTCKSDSMMNIKKTLEKEAKRATWLIIWTDCDREGENIGFEVSSQREKCS